MPPPLFVQPEKKPRALPFLPCPLLLAQKTIPQVCGPQRGSFAGPRLRETSIHICSESQGQTPSQLLPTGVQGLVPSPKAGTNCDSPAQRCVDVRPSGDGSQTPTTGCGWNAGILQMDPTAARPVQASDLKASLAFPRIWPQNAPPWKIMDMLIC